MAVDLQILLRAGQRLTRRHPQLPFDQVLTGDHFGHRVLDLQAGVHFHKKECTPLIEQKLHRAGSAIVDRPRRSDRRRAHALAYIGGKARRRRLLDDLLVAPLHRTIALKQMHSAVLRIAKYLNFYVSRLHEVFFD